VDNPYLQDIVNALFNGLGNPDSVGDGSALAAASAEANGAPPVYGQDHLASTAAYKNGLKNFLTNDVKRLKGGRKVPIIRSERDVEVANSLIKAIDDAQAGRY
jgi:hypothetical protein